MAWDVSFDPVDADEAIAWFADRLILTRDQIETLRANVASRAFYVSGVTQLDVVTHVWEALDVALKQGTTLEDFKASVSGSLERAWQGTVENPGSRIETIFRTNVQSAYTAGRHAEATDPDTIADRPYWMFDAILDDATTPVCEKSDGTVRAADDAWWKSHVPPLHFNCRSHFITLTKDEAHERGITKKPTHEEPSAGFGAPPGDDEWKAKKSDYPPELWKTFEALKPPPSEPLPPRTVKEWAADAKTALASVKDDDGAALRGLLREQLREADLGFVSRDVSMDRPGQGRIVVLPPEKAGASTLLNAEAVHNWDGSIVVAHKVAQDAAAAYVHLANGGTAADMTTGELGSFSVLLHEELHGHSPMVDWNSYKGVGLPFEEAGTEILARKLTRSLLGNDGGWADLPRIVSSPDPDAGRYRYRFFDSDRLTGYNRFIHGIMAGIAEVSGKTDAGLASRVEDAFVEIRANAKARFEKPEDQMTAFLESEALGLTSVQRDAARTLFLTTDILQKYTDFEQEQAPAPKKKPKKRASSRAPLPAS